MSFSDVQPADYFYEPVRYLYCHGVISGYDDHTFRPYNLTTRGQLTKIVVLAEGWAIYAPRPEWSESFDAVLSFFALEHVAAPRQFMADLHQLLKPGGSAYLLVPNVYTNVADFVVADHVNHFSQPSLATLFATAGLAKVSVDDGVHDAAFVVTAQKSDRPDPPLASTGAIARPSPSSDASSVERAAMLISSRRKR